MRVVAGIDLTQPPWHIAVSTLHNPTPQVCIPRTPRCRWSLMLPAISSSLAFTPVQGIELVNPTASKDSKEGVDL